MRGIKLTKAFNKTQKKAITFPDAFVQLGSSVSNSKLSDSLKELFSSQVLSRQIEIVSKLSEIETNTEERKTIVELLAQMIHLPPNPYYLHSSIFSCLKKLKEKCDPNSYTLAINS